MRAVRYEKFGSPEVLELEELPMPEPGPGEVRVRVLAAGLNPVDYKIFHGPAAPAYGASLPSGVGHDLAGVVDRVGESVTDFAPGDAVFGGKRNEALADFAVLGVDGLILPTPAGLPVEIAGSLAIAGRTAWASVAAVGLTDADTVLVSAAAGGVGVLAVQLAVRTGATVIGTAGEHNHEFLRELGVIPVAYGPGQIERIRAAAPAGVTACLDNHGADTIDVALELGVAPQRINTIAARGHRGAVGAGGADASKEDLAEVARLIAAGELVLPIEAVYPLERTREAYQRLEHGHLRGKIVVVTQ